jgi:hypothetical protein
MTWGHCIHKSLCWRAKRPQYVSSLHEGAAYTYRKCTFFTIFMGRYLGTYLFATMHNPKHFFCNRHRKPEQKKTREGVGGKIVGRRNLFQHTF